MRKMKGKMKGGKKAKGGKKQSYHDAMMTTAMKGEKGKGGY